MGWKRREIPSQVNLGTIANYLKSLWFLLFAFIAIYTLAFLDTYTYTYQVMENTINQNLELNAMREAGWLASRVLEEAGVPNTAPTVYLLTRNPEPYKGN